MTTYIWLIPGLPLLGFLVNGLLGRSLGKTFVSVMGPGVIGASFLVSLFTFVEMLDAPGYSLTQHLYTWIQAGDFTIPATLVVDRLSGLYILIITGVGFLIHLYSVGYMGDEDEYAYWRFFCYLNLFVFFMLLLVLGSNFLLLFVGWEGVGLCSYLLIGYYFKKNSAASAAKKAFVVNRIGDFGFIVATLAIFTIFGTLEIAAVNDAASVKLAAGGGAVTAITLLIFLAATGKSAQIPLFVWLPDAMEGPTPVSALIHAATMVTAGLYVVARLSHLFVLAPMTMMVIAIIGAATAFFAATMALAQNDIKRVLAYSTVSQLGYMFMAMGVGAFMVGIFHVMTHAFFKALLFLCSGSVIHAMHHEQDMQKMGGLIRKMPITGWTYVVGALAISGAPLIFAGFFSKDEILWKAFSSPFGHPLFWIVGVITALMTAFYMFRSVSLTFFGKSRIDPQLEHHVHESPWTITLPLVLLAGLAIVGGWVGIPHLLGRSLIPNVLKNYFDGFFAKIPEGIHYGESFEFGLMAVSTLGALAAMYGAYVLFSRHLPLAGALRDKMRPVYRMLSNKYWIDEIYNLLIVRSIHWISDRVLWRIVDVRIIDGIVNGLAASARNLGGALRLTQNGIVENYAVGIVVGAVFIFWWLLF